MAPGPEKKSVAAVARSHAYPPGPNGPLRPHLGSSTRILEKVHFAEVVGYSHHTFIVGAA